MVDSDGPSPAIAAAIDLIRSEHGCPVEDAIRLLTREATQRHTTLEQAADDVINGLVRFDL
jgi:AmiR/NasT family two-component response regulator